LPRKKELNNKTNYGLSKEDRMNKIIKTIATAVLIMVYSSGCASYMVMESSKKRVSYKRTVAKGDQAAIKAFNSGEGTYGIGLDITNLDALKEQPLLQVGAAILDALLIYGSYEGIQKITEDDKAAATDDNTGNNVTVNGDRNEVNIIDGNENDSNQKDSTTTN